MSRKLLPVLVAMLVLAPGTAAQSARTYSQVSTGLAPCVVQTGGALDCWGDVSDGKPRGGTWKQVSVGQNSCAIRSDDTVACWGVNNAGEGTPQPGAFATISVGAYHTCGMRIDTTLVCWGDQSRGARNPVPGQYVSVSAGGYHTCGLKDDGDVACWGIGGPRSGSDTLRCDEPVCLTPWSLPAGKYKAVSAGYDYQCAITASDTLACAGLHPEHPKNTPPAGPFTQVSAGDNTACALRPDGTAACWGDNTFGAASPPAGVTFKQVSASDGVSCGITTASAVVCWGDKEAAAGPDYVAPALSAFTAEPRTFRASPGTEIFRGSKRYGINLRFRLDAYTNFTLVVRKKSGARVGRNATVFAAPNAPNGFVSFRWMGRLPSKSGSSKVPPGRYDLFLTPTDQAGNVGKTIKIPARIKR
jgi:hypothetical protein